MTSTTKCTKCNGTGYIAKYVQYKGGICYACKGTGWIERKTNTTPYNNSENKAKARKAYETAKEMERVWTERAEACHAKHNCKDCKDCKFCKTCDWKVTLVAKKCECASIAMDNEWAI